jgi:hypothetical protein
MIYSNSPNREIHKKRTSPNFSNSFPDTTITFLEKMSAPTVTHRCALGEACPRTSMRDPSKGKDKGKDTLSKLGKGVPDDSERATLRCSKCKQVWYCGRTCQVADWPTHKEHCALLVAEKAKEAEKAAKTAEVVDHCCSLGDACDTGNREHAKSVCSKCTQAWYCGRTCQVADWSRHKKHCRVPVPPEAKTAVVAEVVPVGVAAATVDAADCPICLETIVDPISPCQVTGHKFCRTCFVHLVKEPNLNNCPLCRGTLTNATDSMDASMSTYDELVRMGVPRNDPRYMVIFEQQHAILRIDPKQIHAHVVIATYYSSGVGGVAQDAVQAAAWYLKAAELGDPNSQFIMHHRYEEGDGVPQDDAEQLKWCEMAAAQNHPAAMFDLGMMYAGGRCVEKNSELAAQWIRHAALCQYPNAQLYMGTQSKTLEKAIEWYTQAAEGQGGPIAELLLDHVITTGKNITCVHIAIPPSPLRILYRDSNGNDLCSPYPVRANMLKLCTKYKSPSSKEADGGGGGRNSD